MTTRANQKPITFYLEEGDYAWVTQDAQQLNLSRSAYLRNMVDWWRIERESGRLDGGRAALGPGSAGQSNVGNETSRQLSVAQERIRELEADIEGRQEQAEELTESQARVLTLEGEVRTLMAEKEGLEKVIEIQRDRQGMADSLNQELTTVLNRMTLALPAAGESSGSSGFNWRFWRR